MSAPSAPAVRSAESSAALTRIGLDPAGQPRIYAEGDLDFRQMPTAADPGNGVDYNVPPDWADAADVARRGVEAFATPEPAREAEVSALLSDELVSSWRESLAGLIDPSRIDSPPAGAARVDVMVLADPFVEEPRSARWIGRLVFTPVDAGIERWFVFDAQVTHDGNAWRVTGVRVDPM